MNTAIKFNCNLAKQLQDNVIHTCNRGLPQKFSPHDHSQGLNSQTYTLTKTLWLTDELPTHSSYANQSESLLYRYRAISKLACYIHLCLIF